MAPPDGGQPIRVLQLGGATGLYGAERWILALVRHLDERRVQSIVGALKDSPELEAPLCTEAASSNLRTQIFEAYGKLSLSAVSSLRRFIREHGIHVVHTHGYKTDLVGLLATAGTRCRIVSTPHGWTLAPDFKLWCYEHLDRLIFPFFDAVAPLSPALRDGLRPIPGLARKLHLIRNAVDISEVRAVNTLGSQVREIKGLGKYVIGYIGRLIPDKGVDVLLQALARLSNPEIHLFIIGEGPYRDALEANSRRLGVAGQVSFLGFRVDRLQLLKGFDVFVLPSESEGTPRCVMEAMAAEVACVVTNIPGCLTLIQAEQTGLVFNVGDDAALADSINRLMVDGELSKRLTVAAFADLQQRFSSERMAEEYSSLYERLLANR